MRTISTLRYAILASAIAMLSLTGCAGMRSGTTVTQKKGDQSAKADGEKSADDKKAEERAKDERTLAKLQRSLDVAVEKMQRAEMAQAHAALEQTVAIEKAELDLAIERRRQDNFKTRTVTNRVAWARHALGGSENRLQEAREELEQLKKMYGADDFADGTKEIVLQRGEKRLERSARDYELRGIDFATLIERTIPLELSEKEKTLRAKEQALQKAQRSAEAARLDKAIGIMTARHEIVRLESEIDAHRQKMSKAEKADDSKVAEGG